MQIKKNLYLYELVTADKYETVLAFGDTLEELAGITRLNKSALAMALERNSLIRGCCRIVKVNTKEFEFNFNDYIDFCSTGDLNPKSAKSLQRFKEYCGEVYEL